MFKYIYPALIESSISKNTTTLSLVSACITKLCPAAKTGPNTKANIPKKLSVVATLATTKPKKKLLFDNLN